MHDGRVVIALFSQDRDDVMGSGSETKDRSLDSGHPLGGSQRSESKSAKHWIAIELSLKKEVFFSRRGNFTPVGLE